MEIQYSLIMRLRANPAGIFLILFGLVFLGGGALAAWIEWRIVNDWHSMTAESTGSNVQQFRSRGRTRYQVRYQLRFTAEGREYLVPSNPKLTYGSLTAAQQKAHEYETGTQHRILYSPANPYDIREKTTWILPEIFGGTGLLMILIGVVLPKHPLTRRQVASRNARKAVGAVFLAAGIPLLLAAAVVGSQRSTILTKWPETTATVTRSELNAPQRRYITTVYYQPLIELQYNVHGRQYQSSAPMPRTSNYAAAQARVAEYPIGSEVRVHYDPANPAAVRIDAGWNLNFFLLPLLLGLLGVIFAPLGLLMLVR